MKLQITTITTLLISLLLIFSGCSSNTDPIIKDKQLNAISGERVDLVASNADVYSWSQVSSISVILINANTDTLSFIAPDVNQTESLVFEVEAILPSITDNAPVRKERATVTVHPLETQSDDNATNNPHQLKSITLSISKNSLNIDENTSLNAIATYEDNTTENITDTVEWINSDSNAIQIDKRQLQAKKEINIILQAKLNNITSNQVALEIYREINGHRLPPMPNKTLNDSTLLGIDTNNNGVRDDVERKIYFTYKRPIEQAYMMQDAKWYPQTLEDPVSAAASKELEKEHWNIAVCEGYLRNYKKVPLGVQSVTFMEEAYFNTKQRMRAYIEFNEASSGGVFHIPLLRDYKESNCDFNVTKMLEIE